MSEESTPAPAPSTGSNDPQESNEVVETEAPSRPKVKAPAYRKFKLGDEEVSLSDEDIRRDYSKWKGADAKFREVSQAKKQVEEFTRLLQEDPSSVFDNPNLKFDRQALAEKWLSKRLQQELSPDDPKDTKLSELEERLKAYQDRDENDKKSKEKTAYDQARESRKSEISNTLHQAMQMTQLSADPESAAEVLRTMALYMRTAREHGETVTPEQLVEHVHGSRFNQLYSLAHALDGSELVDFLGEEIVKRIRKHDLGQLRAGRDQGQSHRSEESWAPQTKKVDRMDSKQAQERVRKMFR